MKRFNPTPISLLALAALSVGSVYGQADQLPVSRTAGVLNVTIPINQTTLMALPLVEIVASGTVTAIPSAGVYTLSSSPATLPNVVSSPHAIKIISRVDQSGAAGLFQFSADTTSGSSSIVLTAASTNGLIVGQSLTGPGIPAGATVSSNTNATTFVASANATATATGVTLVSTLPAGTNTPAGSSTNAYGISAQITVQAGQDVTAALSTVPNIGDEYVIYQLETLNSVFGATNTAGLNGSSTAANADTVFVEQAGVFVGYYYKSGGVGGTGWRTVIGNTAAGTTVIPPNKGFMVVRKNLGSSVAIRASGETLPGTETPTVISGFNLLNNPFSVSTTLLASGIQSSITGASSATNADAVFLENAGVITAYYYKTSGVGGTGWRTVIGNTNSDSVLVTAGKSIVFQEKVGAVGFKLPEPFAE